MSSILKALKKLETESPNKGDLRSLPMVRRTAKSARHRARGSRAVYRGIIILFIVGILAGGTWFIFDRKPRDISSSSGVVTDTKTASPDTSHKEDAEPQVARQPEPAAKAVTMAASSVREPVEKTAETETEISSPSPAVTDTKTASPDTSHKEDAEPQVARQPEPAAKAVTMAASSVREPVEKTAETE
ncbi:MAG: hypothetical protein JRF27_03305, partial [Deltaproteobacteria bacterium]|nr:hypothetical protein [Deltaproteobacteria bacterium]